MNLTLPLEFKWISDSVQQERVREREGGREREREWEGERMRERGLMPVTDI